MMDVYKEEFPKDTVIRIASKETLETLKRDWKYHHPLSDDQIKFAGQQDRVRSIGFYHGGDVLYWLENIPGTWHECCLEGIPK